MADLKISELALLAGANLAASDVLPLVDVSASETKKITIEDAIGYGVTLIADATIPGAKIVFNSASIPGSALAAGGVSTAKLADDAVTAAKLGDESSVDLVTTLPATGAFTGQLALDTDDLKVYCWDGSAWQSIKAAGSINTVSGDTSGTINITVTTSGDTVTIGATLDNTAAANRFLAGPTNAGGAVSYRAIDPSDLPTATTTSKGAVQVNGEGLRMDGAVIELDNDVAAGSSHSLVTYSTKGLVTGGRAIQGADLPVATAGGVGAVQPGTGLTVTGAGALNHSNTVTAATATKITYDAQGHVTAGTTLAASDIPDISAAKLTSGIINVSLLGTNSITGTKLANASTVKFGGASSTEGVVTFPTAEFQGQYFFDALNGDLYLYDGSAWQPITITAGELIYAGTYDASLNKVKSVTAAGSAAGLVVNGALPPASNSNLRYYVVVADSGTGTSPAPAVALAPPDMIVSGGTSWELIDVSNDIAGQLASNISFTPYGDIASNNVQTAIQELDDEKLAKAGGTVTGNLEIGSTGSLTWEGSTANAYETTLSVVDPTADRSIVLPDVSGTVVTTGDTGTVTNTMLAGSIADSKLSTISTAGKVSNSATTATDSNTASAIVARDGSGNFSAGAITATSFSGSGASLTSLTAGNLSGTIPAAVLGNSSLFVGTTSVALNRSSGNQALSGISSIALPGSTSGTVTIQPVAAAGTNTLTIPAVTGTVVTTGDTGSVTSTMIADGTIVNADINASAAIAGSKIQAATTSNAGAVQLTDSTSSTSTTTAATPAAVKSAYDLANAALPKAGGTISGNVDNTATGYFDLPAGTTAQRPGTANSGMIRYNTDLSQFEGHNGTAWGTIGGGAKGGGSDQIFYENGQTVNSNYTVGATVNAMSAGPITIGSGITVTISAGGNWVVV